MRIVIIGLGSMGRRRIRILKKLYSAYDLVGVDNNPDRRVQARREFGIEVQSDIRELLDSGSIEAVLVCTAPESHPAIFQIILPYPVHTFSEIDLLLDDYDLLIDAERTRTKRHFISSTPLYDTEMRYIMGCINKNGRQAYRYHVGQYLPDWHPWESYKVFFAGRKKTNGCREILAIELPWMIQAFGAIEEFKIMRSRLTDLEIDFDDNYQILLKHSSGVTGTFDVDLVCRWPVRHLEIYSEQSYLVWEGTPGSLKKWQPDSNRLETVSLHENITRVAGYAETIIENPYEEELNDFVTGILDPDHEFAYSYQRNKSALELIDKMEALQ